MLCWVSPLLILLTSKDVGKSLGLIPKSETLVETKSFGLKTHLSLT